MSDEFLYQIIHAQQLAEHVSQILLQPQQAPMPAYIAGQYVNVLHDNKEVSPLSIACAPRADAVLEFHVYHSTDNRKAQDLMRMVREQNVWRIAGPLGSCTVDRLNHDKPILFLTQGTAFAPIKAVIEAMVGGHASLCPPYNVTYPPMHLFWSMDTPHDVYMTSLLDEWINTVSDFAFTPVFTEEVKNPVMLHELVLCDYADLSDYQVYAAGPRALVTSAYDAFSQRGMKKECFFSDMHDGGLQRKERA